MTKIYEAQTSGNSWGIFRYVLFAILAYVVVVLTGVFGNMSMDELINGLALTTLGLVFVALIFGLSWIFSAPDFGNILNGVPNQILQQQVKLVSKNLNKTTQADAVGSTASGLVFRSVWIELQFNNGLKFKVVNNSNISASMFNNLVALMQEDQEYLITWNARSLSLQSVTTVKPVSLTPEQVTAIAGAEIKQKTGTGMWILVYNIILIACILISLFAALKGK